MTNKSTYSFDGLPAAMGTSAHDTGKASQGGDVRDMNVFYELCKGIPPRHRRSEATAARQACRERLWAMYEGELRSLKFIDKKYGYIGRARLRNGRVVHYSAYRLPRLVQVLSEMIEEALENPAKRHTFGEN